MAHKVIILYRLYMPYYFLGTFTEYPCFKNSTFHCYDRLALLLAHSAFPAFTLHSDLYKARLHLYKPILQD